MLQATDIRKRYGAFLALDGVSLSLRPGDLLGLLGRNGAGKSTLMNILTGYHAASGGTVTLDGMSLADDPAAVKRRIGYLPEVPPLYGELTVAESLRFACEIRGVPRARRRAEIDAAMERADIADRRDQLVKTLSKGYRQRVGLAQATLGEPDVLILDEPGAGLDPTQLTQMRGVIRDYARDHAVLISSHILGEITGVCNRVLVLEQGRAVAQDTLEHLLSGHGAQIVRYAASASSPENDPLSPLRGIANATVALRTEECGAVDASGVIEAVVTPCDGRDVRDEIVAALAASGAALKMLRPRESALEDVFRTLTARARGGDGA